MGGCGVLGFRDAASATHPKAQKDPGKEGALPPPPRLPALPALHLELSLKPHTDFLCPSDRWPVWEP